MTSQSKQKKIEALEKIEKDLKESQATYLVNYRGLTVSQISELREKLREVGAKMIVAKNTLMSRAFNSAKMNVESKDSLTGPTATVFAFEDQISPLRILSNFAKSVGLPELKVGFLDHELLDKPRLEQLALLPEKNVLQAQVVGGISAPLYGLVHALQGNLSNLVFTLEQIKNQKPQVLMASGQKGGGA